METSAKRKNDDVLNGSILKAPRIGAPDGSTDQPKHARPSVANATRKGLVKPMPKPAHSRSLKTSAAPQATNGSAPQPKKGSYREIMARAQAAKASQVHQIKHKPTLKAPKKSHRALEAEKAAQAKKISSKEDRPDMQRKTANGAIKKPGAAEAKRVKQFAPVAYQGTMRRTSVADAAPKPPLGAPAQKSSSQTSRSFTGLKYKDSVSSKRHNQVCSEGEDEEEDDDNDEEMDDDMSDGSETMVGGGFDELEAEEESSLRAARKEDAEALKEENEHRRQKLERKRKLQQLAAKAPKPKY